MTDKEIYSIATKTPEGHIIRCIFSEGGKRLLAPEDERFSMCGHPVEETLMRIVFIFTMAPGQPSGTGSVVHSEFPQNLVHLVPLCPKCKFLVDEYARKLEEI